MGYLLTIACYIFSYSPALALFVQFIAHDPVRIILFFLGAFFWLCSLLISSMVWFTLTSVFELNAFYISLAFCIIAQEFSRIVYFLLLKKAQSGLNKITRSGTMSVAPGVSDLHNARHMLALVCGLGMGLIAALFFTMNAFAAFAGPGAFGLPEALDKNERDPNGAGKYLPLYYCLSALFLTMFHVTWTIMVWDSCHKIGRIPSAYVPGAAALVSHLFVSFISSLNAKGFYVLVLSVQFLILIICIAYCNVILGRSMTNLANSISAALIDAITFKYLRELISRRQQRTRESVVQDEPLTERNPQNNTIET